MRACTVHTTIVVGLHGHNGTITPLLSLAWRCVGLLVPVYVRARASRGIGPSGLTLFVARYGNGATSHNLVLPSFTNI
jgi:hypothetical protein